MNSEKKKINDQISVHEFDLTDIYNIVSLIVRNYWVVVISIIISISYTIFYLKNTPISFTTTLSVIPVENVLSTSNASGDTSISSIFGFSLPNVNSSENDFLLYKELLKSRSVSKELSKDKEFMTTFYSSKWDNIGKKWIKSEPNFTHKMINFVKSFIGLPIITLGEPNEFTIFEYITDNVKISTDKKTNITLISIESTRPLMSALMLNRLHAAADRILKNKSIQRTDAHIEFLTKRLSKTLQFDQKQSLIIALADEQKKRMMASSSLPYIAEPFDGEPRTSFYPTKPKAKETIIKNSMISIAIGCLLPILFVFFRNFFNKLKDY